ncbi:MAG: M48 family metallopeptidase [Calditerrivibrio sp.]|nr:M48 family metallopeptidase [Calditerrivibrio sp.]MCA1932998.1 M48 family metallopeptidase [Calditerrivibrio sp.]
MVDNDREIVIEKIVRSKRKTVGLQVTDDATLVVRAPFGISNESISYIVSKHINWINQKRYEIKLRNLAFSPRKFVDGERFLFLGESYELKIVESGDERLKFQDKFYLTKSSLTEAIYLFIDWYKRVGFEKMLERVKFYANIANFKYNRINISNSNKIWGSCSSNGNLNFSWRIIMAPLPVVDYVVVHELVHLEVRNHSKDFWDRVSMLMPDYKKQKVWLKNNGYLLRLK